MSYYIRTFLVQVKARCGPKIESCSCLKTYLIQTNGGREYDGQQAKIILSKDNLQFTLYRYH